MPEKIITRQIQIHRGADGVQVQAFGPHQWLLVQLAEDESITVFLQHADVKRLLAELRHLDETLERKAADAA